MMFKRPPSRILICLGLMVGGCAEMPKVEHQRARPSSVEREVAEAAAPADTQPRLAPLIVEGSGRFVSTPSAPASPARLQEEGYQLSFVDTEISTVVGSVIGDGLGLSYSIDPQIKGTMTLQAARPLARNEMLPALESALNLHGAALVETSGAYQVVPVRDAPRRAGLQNPSTPRAAGFRVRVVPIQYVGVAEMEKVLRPFAPEGGIVSVDSARNLLILAGSSGELQVMQNVVDTFDVDWLSGMSFAMYPVVHVEAKTLADELGAVFADNRSPIVSVVRFVPLARLNSLMVVTHEPSYLRQVEAWIKRLDTSVATPGRRIHVYDVQNGKADELAESLSDILSISYAGNRSGASSSRRDVDTSQRERSLLSRGGADSSFASSGSTFSTTNQAVEPLAPRSAPSTTTADSAGALKIVPNIENNALLIYATPGEYTTIEDALRRLDVRPIQVLIEASLAEVSLNDDLRFGVQWAFSHGDGPMVLSDRANGQVNAAFPGFSYLYSGNTDIRAVLNTLETVTDVHVISSPKLLVLNNREAEMQVGDQVPITVQSAISTVGETAPIVNSVQLRDTGVILRITPRVNKSGLVLLDIAQEVSDVVPTTTSNIDSPTIQQRRISSTVAVQDGETIALGGLIRDSVSRTRGGVPLLHKIPLVGNLFGSSSNTDRRTELIILITPRVIRSRSESESMMQDLREQFGRLKDSLPEITSTPSEQPAEASGDPEASSDRSGEAQ